MHIKEHEQDIMDLMRRCGGSLVTTQTRLAKQLNAPLRSIKLALTGLEVAGLIFRRGIRRGRKSFTVIIAKTNKCKKQMVHSHNQYGVQWVDQEVVGYELPKKMPEYLLL